MISPAGQGRAPANFHIFPDLLTRDYLARHSRNKMVNRRWTQEKRRFAEKKFVFIRVHPRLSAISNAFPGVYSVVPRGMLINVLGGSGVANRCRTRLHPVLCEDQKLIPLLRARDPRPP